MRIQLITLGCSKNRVDSEHLLKQIYASGIAIAPESEDLSKGEVDTVIINTCGFIKDAKQESIDTIFSAIDASAFSNYFIWVAQYNTTCNYKGKYNMWQYSSKGSVPGIKGNVDVNIAY
jgi:hypothetical protein